jgi:hypothetical protein
MFARSKRKLNPLVQIMNLLAAIQDSAQAHAADLAQSGQDAAAQAQQVQIAAQPAAAKPKK